MNISRSKLSPELDIGVGCYLLVVAVLSIVGNLLVLVIAFKRSSRMKPPELLSVNLAVTDLGAAITMYPLAVASAWNHRWLGGESTCTYYGMMGFFFGVASIMNLTVLATVRFVVSLNMQSPKDRISWVMVKVLCMWIWVYGLLWALFPILGWGRYGLEPFGLSCSLAWGQLNNEGDFTFLISLSSFNLIGPCVVIICCYFGIAIKLYLTYKHSLNRNRVGKAIRLHRRLLRIAVLISVGFMCSWTPYAAVSMWSALKGSDGIPPVVTLLPCLFAKTSTVYNPLIYYIFSQNFNREVKQLATVCFGPGLCHASNSINDNSLYTISANTKAKAATMSLPMKEITQNEGEREG
ncbi:opsin 8, group member b [Genypterus blacodes]|uniref:opsin 8, group member b n=1 Tax=Genypterus blacodes TaxID=154954 RepID=UPI003F75E637